ncbi:MAG: hypothetical protein IPP19_10365 [Verrucomicrobia bacterium]|nr:hypothetical protein [Verrucomicrobiota bacterium]
MRIVLVVLILAILLLAVAFVDIRAVWFFLAILLVVGLLVGVYYLFKQWKKKRAGQAFSKGLDRTSRNTGGDRSQRARMADMHEVVGKGLKAFADAGKDVYSLPWYIVCGEPGSGKTETIRHSGVGFPPGLHDEMQGVGGTINMHWWFTNHAVLLDIAGKILFNEAQQGGSSEWVEFLNLLKTHRKNCPINGLLLVIPADSLLRDNPDEIQKKAGRIVRHLEQMQKVLDVRFPVFVIVTKCDLIYGFREFFANVDNPRLQQQMLGWSNPDPLDVPFRSDLVSSFLDSVAARLRRRRLLLMRDPVAVTPGGRRLDEADSFFDFPTSVSAMAPRLKEYLDILFVSGEWTQKPLFLRGVYFTSALIEGKALDVELAAALGIPIDHLPEQKTWDRNRSFFLRDLFLHKVFCEKGLVTGASNTRTILRRRYAILGGVAAIGLALVTLVSWMGQSALKHSVISELPYWKAGAEGWSGDRWHPVVVSGKTPGSWSYAGRDSIMVGQRKLTVVDFQSELEKLASRNLPVPLVYRPIKYMVAGTDDLRRKAQRVIFERGVVEPLVTATRAFMLDQRLGWDDVSADRVALMLRIEGLLHCHRNQNQPKGLEQKIDPEYFFRVTLQPWLKNDTVPHELVRVFERTLPQTGRNPWPEPWLSAGTTFDENQPVSQGWAAFLTAVRGVRKDQQAGLDMIRNTRVAVESHLTRENAFMRSVRDRVDDAQWQRGVDSAFEAMSASRSTVDEMLNRTAALDGMPSSLFTLKTAYQAMFERAKERSKNAARAIAAACVVPGDAEKNAEQPELELFVDINRRFADVDKAIDEAYQQALPAREMNAIPKLDMEATVPAAGTSDRVFAYRFDVFKDTVTELFARTDSATPLLGRLGVSLTAQQSSLGRTGTRGLKYEGEFRQEFSVTVQTLIAKATEDGPVNMIERYSRELEQTVVNKTGFPVIRAAGGMKEAQMREFYALVEGIAGDGKLDTMPPSAKTAYAKLAGRINHVVDLVRAVALPTGQGVSVKISAASLADQRKVIEKLVPGMAFAEVFAGNRFRSIRMGEKAVRTQGANATEILTVSASDALPALEFFVGAETKPKTDTRVSVTGTWAPLRLIAQEKGCVRLDGGRTWLCPIEVVTAEAKTYFVLSLQFEQAVPALDQWP